MLTVDDYTIEDERAARAELARLEELAWQRQCRRDFTAFAIEALKPMRQVPARHHKLLIDKLEAVARGECKRLMIFMPPGHAKALALDTPIPTPRGWKAMGELQVGDQVFDEQGKACTVTWVSPVWRNRPVYTVRTDCGDTIIADEAHEWLVRMCGKRPVFKIKETWQLAKRRSKRPMIRRAGALDGPSVPLPIDPYLLGLWLGDGHSAGVRLTAGLTDQEWYRRELTRLGYQCSGDGKRLAFGVLGVRSAFVSLGLLGNKHVPAAYLRASQEQRLALLQGLIDTDGSVSPDGQIVFSNTNLSLAEAVQELVRSLGAKAIFWNGRAILNGKDCGPVYRVSFYLQDAARLPRKRRFTRNAKRTRNTYIDVEFAGLADTICIEVDSASHLFLCGRSMTPTHNSTYSSVLFPAWFFAQRKHVDIIGASHVSDLAEDFSYKIHAVIRDNPEALGYGLLTENVKRWRTTNGGFYRAVGVGGSITGRRADLGIIDDPVKGHEDAESPDQREKVWRWYQSDFLSRLKPDAAQIVIQTRWHEDDLSGRLLAAAADGADQWDVISMPAICDSVDDPIGRKIGDPLWPEMYDAIFFLGGLRPEHVEGDRVVPAERVAGKRKNVGEYVWGSLYQQNPKPRGSAFFDEDYLLVPNTEAGLDPLGRQIMRPLPMPKKCDTVFAIIDSAIKAGTEHNATAVTFYCYDKLTQPISTLILDWDIIQIEGADQAAWLPTVHARGEELARETGARYGYSGALIEDKATGTVLIQQSQNEARAKGRKSLARAIDSKLTAMGKEERAIAAAPYVIAGRVKITEEAYHKTAVLKGKSANHFLAQVTAFRLGSKAKDGLDLLDTFCYGVLVTCAPNAGDRKGI